MSTTRPPWQRAVKESTARAFVAGLKARSASGAQAGAPNCGAHSRPGMCGCARPEPDVYAQSTWEPAHWRTESRIAACRSSAGAGAGAGRSGDPRAPARGAQAISPGTKLRSVGASSSIRRTPNQSRVAGTGRLSVPRTWAFKGRAFGPVRPAVDIDPPAFNLERSTFLVRPDLRDCLRVAPLPADVRNCLQSIVDAANGDAGAPLDVLRADLDPRTGRRFGDDVLNCDAIRRQAVAYLEDRDERWIGAAESASRECDIPLLAATLGVAPIIEAVVTWLQVVTGYYDDYWLPTEDEPPSRDCSRAIIAPFVSSDEMDPWFWISARSHAMPVGLSVPANFGYYIVPSLAPQPLGPCFRRLPRDVRVPDQRFLLRDRLPLALCDPPRLLTGAEFDALEAAYHFASEAVPPANTADDAARNAIDRAWLDVFFGSSPRVGELTRYLTPPGTWDMTLETSRGFGVPPSSYGAAPFEDLRFDFIRIRPCLVF